jgi:hypothetical protein
MERNQSIQRRRSGVIVNYSFLLLVLVLSFEGYWLGWSLATKIGFWLSVAFVIVTFFPLHVHTGLWRLAHAKADDLDEREIQQNYEAVRYSYAIFTVLSLCIILVLVIFGLGGQAERLIVFWVLLYLAHTLPSSILAWTSTRVPAQAEA